MVQECIRQLGRKERTRTGKTDLGFIDLEKAHDNVKWKKLFDLFLELKVDAHTQKMIEAMYEDNTVTTPYTFLGPCPRSKVRLNTLLESKCTMCWPGQS